MRTCSVEGCDKPHASRGWCAGHYARWKRGQAVDDVPLHGRRRYPPDAICSFEGCDKPRAMLWFCRTHYDQQRLGMPLRPIRYAVVPDVLKRLSITYRQFDYWCRNGYVQELKAQGSGSRRFQELTDEQEERLGALAAAAKLQATKLPDLADAIQDGTVKCLKEFRGD